MKAAAREGKRTCTCSNAVVAWSAEFKWKVIAIFVRRASDF